MDEAFTPEIANKIELLKAYTPLTSVLLLEYALP
jgi:hypothetical protein